MDETLVHPVILSGGAGTRLRPASREMYLKQLLPLVSEKSLLAETALRVGTTCYFSAPTVICNEAHRFLVAEAMRRVSEETGWRHGSIILEPCGRNTAPAAAVAAVYLAESDPDALMLLLPSDHAIADGDAFRDAVIQGSYAAAARYLVTFGMSPTYPETGYGYIRIGEALAGLEGCYQVAQFVEKPDHATAERYMGDASYSWNSGMFLLPVRTVLDELARLHPDILEAAHAALENAQRDMDCLRLDAEAFEQAPTISIDHAVMEHTNRAAVVPAEMGWSDVGSWA